MRAIGLSKRYGERVILDKAGFELQKGDIIALVGRNGSGKTTLLNIIARLDKDHEGTVELEGMRPGYVFQNPSESLLPWKTARQNILLDRHYSERRLRKVAELCRIKHLLDAYPRRLSGGEKQLVTIARALVRGYDLLLLDEPFSSLDPEAKERLKQHLQRIAGEGIAMIIVTHSKEDIEGFVGSVLRLDHETHSIHPAAASHPALLGAA
jgi:sulfonate transport system ATP-binding protein